LVILVSANAIITAVKAKKINFTNKLSLIAKL